MGPPRDRAAAGEADGAGEAGEAGEAGSDATLLLTNSRLAAALAEMADLIDIKGDSSFKVGAYRRASDSVARSSVDVATAYRAGHPPALAGVGKSISERIAELSLTGSSPYLEDLRDQVPPTLMTFLAIPGVGPRTAGEIWRVLGIATLVELETAAREGRLRSVKGISARTEKRIIDGIGEIERRPPRRMLMGEAHLVAERVVELVSAIPGVASAVSAGSIRRFRETVGDLDVLVETETPAQVMAALRSSPAVEGGGGGHPGATDATDATEATDATGADRGSIRLLDGPGVDVMTMPAGVAGSYLVHFTGSAEHNVRLRQRARRLGWSLSEHGLTPLGDESADEAGTSADGALPTPTPTALTRTFATEIELYEALGLPFIEPELREDAGEIEAAEAGALPRLVRRDELRGDCHSHSDWSDGREPLEVMVASARSMGHAYQVITDHSQSITIANGLSPERVEQQRRVIGELNESFAREVARGEAPPGADPGFRLLHGCELEITLDGRLDYEDDLLARFDVVTASLHVGRRQPRARLMARYELALRSPHVDIITHPSGRKIGQRDDLDLDWEAFYRMAAETGTLLEVNGSEERLDLDEHRIRAALDAGCGFTIDSDAHDRTEWRNLDWGVAIARRGWLERGRVANTLELEPFLELMAQKPHRLLAGSG